MTKEQTEEMLSILQPLMFESYKWSEIKQYMIERLPVETSTYILNDLCRYNKAKHIYAPKDDTYYFVRYSVKQQKVTVSRDLNKSPRSEKELKFKNKQRNVV